MTLYSDTFDSIVADVITLTGRPDLAAEIEFAVRTATLSSHAGGAYLRDLNTELVQLVSPAYLTAIDIGETLPRCRGVATLSICDSSFVPLESPEIEIVEIGDIRDPVYKMLKNDIAYLAGSSLNVRSSVPSYGYLVEYYTLPSTRRETFNSWIAQLMPAIIVYRAASIVHVTSGNVEKGKLYQTAVDNVFKPQLDSSFLTSILR
jgi:hypothetical protein